MFSPSTLISNLTPHSAERSVAARIPNASNSTRSVFLRAKADCGWDWLTIQREPGGAVQRQ